MLSETFAADTCFPFAGEKQCFRKHKTILKQKHVLLLEIFPVWQNWETVGKHVSAANVSDIMFPHFQGFTQKRETKVIQNTKFSKNREN